MGGGASGSGGGEGRFGGDGLTALYISSQTKFLDFRYYLKHRFFNHFFFF